VPSIPEDVEGEPDPFLPHKRDGSVIRHSSLIAEVKDRKDISSSPSSGGLPIGLEASRLSHLMLTFPASELIQDGRSTMPVRFSSQMSEQSCHPLPAGYHPT
jgi:hypothetical protein